ncbi:MAG: adenosylcobalamin-dependent ribonucleoside-diphosphate reductase [Planctomycetota bacterium]
MKITRKFTTDGVDPFSTTAWVRRHSKISNPDGSVVFEMPDAEVPKGWSQLATDIMVSKYFRKAGVPVDGGPNGIADPDGAAAGGRGFQPPRTSEEVDEPSRRQDASATDPGPTGPEKSARQVIHRLAGCWRYWGESHGYFDSKKDAQAFEDELKYMLTHQIAAPNSPQWFNTGLHWAYGITGPAQGHWVVDSASGVASLAGDAYSHPQPHACFIQSVDDDLVNPGGIMDLWTREARLFKYGSGTGTNFSGLRGEGELLAGGGKSSGLMSWLRIGDRAAGAIKSGGTTRRAAKMVCLDLDHPDIEDFINWKVREEIKVAALVEGMKAIAGEKASASDPETVGETAARLGLTLDYDFNGESYQTVSGQNANNSVRIPNDFFEAVDADAKWELTFRLDGAVAKAVDAKDLWQQVAYAAWRCADPGVQYDTTINEWHTCPGSGRINASNPCSEYMFLDNTACNLASINLLKFWDPATRSFDVEKYEHAIDLWTVVLEISVLMAAFPSEAIAQLSYEYRTLGLGYANLGAMLMQAGVPYDSEEGRAVCACLTAILTGRSYRQSSLLAKEHGAFPGAQVNSNAESMMRVIRNHRRAAHGVDGGASEWEALSIRPVSIDHELIGAGRIPVANMPHLLTHATKAWDDAERFGAQHGFRNAQVSVIAPTGTIGLLMDCDTTGVEPDFALVKFKKLAGGGYFKIANGSLRPALEALGYTDSQVKDILRYVLGSLSLNIPMPTSDGAREASGTLADFLKAKGLNPIELKAIEDQLAGVFELKFALSAWSLGDAALGRLGIDAARAKADFSFDLLAELGLTAAQRRALNEKVCGTQTVEGSPHLKAEHLPVFDCANTCGEKGTRFIAAEGHIRMMAAAQPFISGAISKTINLPNSASVDDIKAAYRLSWELGLKANALYRDGCKLSQPLSTKSSDAGDQDSTDAGKSEALETEAAILAESALEADPVETNSALQEIVSEVAAASDAAAHGEVGAVERVVERIVHRPMRQRLPETRRSVTHKFNVAGHEGYLTVGLYEDGQPGELFITMSKEGSTIGGLMDSLGTAVSVALQYGVPTDSLVRKFSHQRFEPAGMTTNRDIPLAKSLVDYIFRWMGMQFIEGYREANAPRRPSSVTHEAAVTESKPVTRVGVFTGDEDDDGDRGGGEGSAVDSPRSPESTPRRIASASLDDTVDETITPSLGEPVAGMTSAAPAESPMGIAGESGGPSVSTAPGAGAAMAANALDEAMRQCQDDAPACSVCGSLTVRNGSCYRCLNCGHSQGCS